MPTKRHLPFKDLFLLLCSLKNEVGWVQAPNSRSLMKFLSEKVGIRHQLSKEIDELTKLGYIQKYFHGNTLWRIRILIPEWDENRLSESPKPAKPREKRFAVFMDYVNLEKGLKKSPDKFRDFSWLTNQILEQGKLIFAFVFIPEHYVGRAPIMLLTHKHRFQPILCPRQIQTGGSTTKDADTVDAQLIALATGIIDHSDITDIIIVSGDADFQPLITHAIWQQKSVTVRSGSGPLSGRIMEMAEDSSLSVQLVS